MARIVVIYKTPKDAAAFDKHYAEVHVPLVRKLAGLRKFEMSKGPIATPGGPSGLHLIATLHFDDMAALQKALTSPEGQAAGADAGVLAPGPGDVQILMFDSHEA
jgi:uncharacterized protein (TIGR02118 family)